MTTWRGVASPGVYVVVAVCATSAWAKEPAIETRVKAVDALVMQVVAAPGQLSDELSWEELLPDDPPDALGGMPQEHFQVSCEGSHPRMVKFTLQTGIEASFEDRVTDVVFEEGEIAFIRVSSVWSRMGESKKSRPFDTRYYFSGPELVRVVNERKQKVDRPKEKKAEKGPQLRARILRLLEAATACR